ncbi:MAG TPA: hypothetical protein VK714_01920 [Myxococcota bacterium]|nr:hypothetical protein [Myxococcota bacterium]
MSESVKKINGLEHQLDAAIRDLSVYDREALKEAINKPAHSVFFDVPGVREKARVWCEKVLKQDPTVKLRRFQNALKHLCEWYDRGKS